MSKKIFLLWGTVLAASMLCILLGAGMVTNVREGDVAIYGSERFERWNVSCSEVPDENGLYRITYINILPGIEDGGEVMTFYSYHGNVYAYVEGNLIYSLNMDTSNVYFPVVPGNQWNCIYISQEYAGKMIEIRMESKYKSCLEYEPGFYLGDKMNIVKTQVKDSIPEMLLCTVIFAVGIIVIIYSLLITRNNYENYGMLYLGVFAILMSVWFVVNMPVLNMLMDKATILTNISYLVLGAVVVPIVLFEKRIIDARYGKACNLLCMIAVCVQLMCVILQLLGIKDLKETLIYTHIVFIIAIGGLIIMLVLNLKNVGFRNLTIMNKINILFGILLAVGVGCDLIRYYADAGGGRSYMYTKLAFLVYIVTVSYFSVCETVELMKMGKDAQKYEEMAHIDGLTGVYNRMACNDDMNILNLTREKYMVFMFDLNNLKQCNDTLGHNCGDLYIKLCAKCIREAFEGLGKCYRIGGDEFCVIGEAVGDEIVDKCYFDLKEKLENCNRENPMMNMSIAYGHTIYDSELDQDLRDTRERAYKIMYRCKMEMKGPDDKRK